MTPDLTPRLSRLTADLDRAAQTAATGNAVVDQAVLVFEAASVPGAGAPEAETTNRRTFLARASALSLAIPGLSVALAACAPDAPVARDSTISTARTGGAVAGSADGMQHLNSNSRLDTAMLQGTPHPSTSAAADGVNAGDVKFHRYDPALPPLPVGNRLQLHFHAREAAVRINDDTVVAAWTFEGDLPGPIVHCKVGDAVEFTLTNDVAVPHSMDFHAAQINPKEAFKSVMKGDSLTFTFKPKWAGAFMYHCGTAPVLMHIGAGMYGAIVVSPREPLAPAKEFVLIQSEFYLAEPVNGVRAFDYQKMLATTPDFVVFNGRPNQYVAAPIRVKVGDRVRFWVVVAGPTHPCNFHVVGEQFDTVYIAAPPGSPLHGVQTFTVAPGGGMCFELLCDVPGEFPFVNHGFGHGQKGSIGFLVVEP